MPRSLSRGSTRPMRPHGVEQEVTRDVKMWRLRQQSRCFGRFERDFLETSLVREHGTIILPDEAQPDGCLEPLGCRHVFRSDPKACEALAQITPEQIISDRAVQTDSAAEPRELGSEDPGRPAEFQAVVVDELLRLRTPHGDDIPFTRMSHRDRLSRQRRTSFQRTLAANLERPRFFTYRRQPDQRAAGCGERKTEFIGRPHFTSLEFVARFCAKVVAVDLRAKCSRGQE